MNLNIFIIAAVYAYWQNSYFGWNYFPKSDAEIISDGIAAILFALAFFRAGDGK